MKTVLPCLVVFGLFFAGLSGCSDGTSKNPPAAGEGGGTDGEGGSNQGEGAAGSGGTKAGTGNGGSSGASEGGDGGSSDGEAGMSASGGEAGGDDRGGSGGDDRGGSGGDGGDDGGGSAGSAGTGNEDPVEVYSPSAEGFQEEGFAALVGEYEGQYPGSNFHDVTSDYPTKDAFENALIAHEPPDSFEIHSRAELEEWALSTPRLSDVKSIYGEAGLTTVPGEVLAEMSVAPGEVHAVPLAVSRTNTMFINPSVFAAAGVEVPSTTDELLAAAEALSLQGYTPLCMGNQYGWAAEMLVFDHILPAVAGPDTYEQFFSGDGDPQGSAISSVFDYVLELWPYFNTNAAELTWSQGLDLMFSETSPCAMAPMFSEASAYLESAGHVPGTDFSVVGFPGPTVFIFGVQAYVLPEDAPHPQAARDWLKTIGSVAGQQAYAQKGGFIPAREDVNSSALDAVGQVLHADWLSQLPLANRAWLRAAQPALFDTVSALIDDADKAAAIEALDAAYF
ncbi:MAG TPA: ABC transporter substrate-binding protein [Polyangiaceae bacterium]|nr:ABC transporter substrate-binding protein [Polyangiaceae bacterium]